MRSFRRSTESPGDPFTHQLLLTAEAASPKGGVFAVKLDANGDSVDGKAERLLYYLDTSALVKLVFAESESVALDTFVASRELVISALSRVELRRVAQRVSPKQLPNCDELLASCFEVLLTAAMLDRAGTAQPASLGSLDAVHLTVALTLGSDLEAFVAYDDRLLAAAEQAGLVVAKPR